MKNRFLLVIVLSIATLNVLAKNNLPIDTLGSKDASKPLVLYISGDGGFNSFSTSFVKQWNRLGYPVVALNARSYFFSAQSPDSAAKDISALVAEYLKLWKRNEFILVGYSFGADVLPFIQMRLAPFAASKLKHSVLLSPSHYTDFAVHLFYSHKGNSVPAEINKLNKPALIIFGDEEEDTPDKEIKNQWVKINKISGDHHYDKQIDSLVSGIIKQL